MKHLFSKDGLKKLRNLKPKGFKRHEIKWKKFHDHRLRTGAKEPENVGAYNLGNHLRSVQMWLEGFAVDVGSQVIKNIIPGYFWILLVVGIVIVLLVGS